MRPILLMFAAALLAFGCSANPATDLSNEPLALEEWRVMPSEAKFQAATMERLKLGNPKLQDDREWERFLRTVVIPARKKELPRGMPAK